MPTYFHGHRAFGMGALLWLSLLWLSLLWWIAHPRLNAGTGELRVTVLDVGQGDCILVEMPNGRAMLIDGGGSADETQVDSTDIGMRTVVPFLRHEGINHLDVVALTHPHGDHCGGLTAVLREETVGVVLDGTVIPYPSADYQAFRQEIAQRHIPYQHAVRGMRLNFGDGVTALILNPPATGTPYGTGTDDTTINNYSIVMRLTYGQTHFLLTGDAEFSAENSILATGADLRSDVLKVGHHGAANATSDTWLAHVQPRYAAISCGLHNAFGHPAPATVARLAAHHVLTYCTAWNGAITFTCDGKTVTAKSFVTRQPSVSSPEVSAMKVSE